MSDETTVETVQAELKTEIENAKKLRARAQEAESKIADLEGKVLSDDDRKLFDTLKTEREEIEHKTLEDKGKYEEILAKQKADSAKVLDAKDVQITALTAGIQQEVGFNKLASELGSAGVKAELIAQASQLLAGQVKVTLKDGQAVVQITNVDGTSATKDDGTAKSIKDLVEGWLPNNQHFLPPSGDSGSGSHKGGGTGEVTIAELDADPQKKVDFIQKEGAEAYHKLAAAARKAKE